MAAGKTLTVKLRYRSRPCCKSTISPGLQENNIRESVMALTSEAAMHPVMELPSDSIPTSLDHGNPMSITIPQGPPMVPLTTAAILSQRRRRKSTTSMKRSASTPNVRGHHSGDAGMTLAEKRRNKLGYHRTSVACGMFGFV